MLHGASYHQHVLSYMFKHTHPASAIKNGQISRGKGQEERILRSKVHKMINIYQNVCVQSTKTYNSVKLCVQQEACSTVAIVEAPKKTHLTRRGFSRHGYSPTCIPNAAKKSVMKKSRMYLIFPLNLNFEGSKHKCSCVFWKAEPLK